MASAIRTSLVVVVLVGCRGGEPGERAPMPAPASPAVGAAPERSVDVPAPAPAPVPAEVQDFLTKLGQPGGPRDALAAHGREGLDDRGLRLLLEATDVVILARDGDCYELRLTAGETTRRFRTCWKAGKIDAIDDLGWTPFVEASPRSGPLALAAAGIRVELPGGWRIAAGDDLWSARAAAPAGELRCIIEWWPAGFVPDEEHHELPLGDRPGKLFASDRGMRVRALERDGAVLACAWSRKDEGAEAVVDGIVGSLRAVERPVRPDRVEARHRRLCGFRGPSGGRVLALARDGVAWLGDPASGELRRIDGDDHRTIACDDERGLLLTRDGAVVRVGGDMTGERVVPEPSGIADGEQVVALASQFLVRADGRLVHWNHQTEGQALAMRLPAKIAAAWGSGTDGCVLSPPDRLWCWGSEEERQDMPPVRFTGAGERVNRHTGASALGPQSFEFTQLFRERLAPDPVLERHAGAMCVQAGDRWHCIDRFGGQRTFPACAAQTCRCVTGRRGLHCSDAPLDEVPSSPPTWRVDDVVLAGAGLCVERRDGAIACHAGDVETVLRPSPPSPTGE